MPPPTLSLAAPSMSIPLDPPRVAELAGAYGRTVFLSAFRVLGDAAQAEDVQQDLFVQLLERPVPEVGNWPAFLATSATRMAIDRLRRQRRWLRLLPEVALQALGASVPQPDQHADQAEQAAWLRARLARLPRLQAQCFALRHLDGLDNAAIARALGIAPGHVAVCLHRAGRALCAHITPWTANEPEKLP
ncbi:MAG: sigma-70 family RNA polymerase sigma factor [Pseudoxanthomonas sp.]|nr:sigma-70 family RNA polymerase sigma factor [Pseudoxanthomonas sp.]